jgi:hypothetical protein
VAEFKWYRRVVGGNWFLCRALALQDAVFFWTQDPESEDNIVDSEVWQ